VEEFVLFPNQRITPCTIKWTEKDGRIEDPPESVFKLTECIRGLKKALRVSEKTGDIAKSILNEEAKGLSAKKRDSIKRKLGPVESSLTNNGTFFTQEVIKTILYLVDNTDQETLKTFLGKVLDQSS